ncbi:hypothetical protein LNKW23_31640 [Paralimibaculum aggregatum]|uniref:Multidrug resistance protein MdtA-like C-terminal permuted SH3 domain-containing protein n=1 Tax=Paralimibaculum aggregatum TaxID=3036245 RepID=A0ABQ6LRQ8_9RHOB|nr:hypothetical protein [Limibaculum sp. NKW23]GMG83950.1 hypothetical protein LNKW23_31640 [Limibaculum sp. NKW23]
MVRAAIRILSFAVPVALAVAVLMVVLGGRQPPQQAALAERARSVRVITVAPVDFVPGVTGYGSVAPVRTWDAVAQVPGRIAFVHPRLRVGAVLREGLEIIRIREEDYELAVQEARSNLDAAEAQLRELEVSAENAGRSLEIERRSMEIKRADLERQEGLVKRGVASQSTLDTVERDFLTQQVRVQELENAVRLFPAQIATQRTQIAVAEARLATARLELERTSIRMPFRGRISEIGVEATQFVASGTRLAAAGDISAAEIVAQVPQDQFARFVSLAVPGDFIPVFEDDGESESTGDPRAAMAALDWEATVTLQMEARDVRWPAQVMRTADAIDAGSRSVGVIVQVEGPYADLKPGTRPPLVKGMFVRVELRGRALEAQRVIPRGALHDGRVFVADAENRLRVREVAVRAVQGSDALIAAGLEFGERVVVSDLSPAIEGMLLDPVEAAGGGEPAE